MFTWPYTDCTDALSSCCRLFPFQYYIECCCAMPALVTDLSGISTVIDLVCCLQLSFAFHSCLQYTQTLSSNMWYWYSNSVHMSACLRHSGIVSKQLIISKFFQQQIIILFSSELKSVVKFGWGLKYERGVKKLVLSPIIHRVPKKEATKLLAITFSNFNRFLKFFHCWIEDEYLQQNCIMFSTTP